MTTKRVVVEVRVPCGLSPETLLSFAAYELKVPGFEVDTAYTPVTVPLQDRSRTALLSDNEEVVVVRGTLTAGAEAALEREPRVIAVWSDPVVEPFGSAGEPSGSDLAF